MQYDDAFSDLVGVSLEDSWVLELAPSDDGLALRLDTVLTPAPALRDSEAGRTALLPGRLADRASRPDRSASQREPPARGASGELDFGHVDAFVFNEADDRWELEGHWGRASANSPEVPLWFA